MKLTDLFILTFFLFYFIQPARAQSPVGVTAPDLSLQDNVVEIVYDILNSSVTDKFTIRVEVSDANGRFIQARSLSGDIGEHIDGGSDKKIFWDIEADSIFLDEEIFIQVYARAEPPLLAETPLEQENADMEQNPVMNPDPDQEVDPVGEIKPEQNEDLDQEPDAAPTLQDQSIEIPEPAYENLLETSGRKSFSRAGVVLQSLALPGLGLSRVHPGKPHWIKGVMGYGCIAGSLYLNRRAADNYASYQQPTSLEEVDILYNLAVKQDVVSEVLAYTAIGIWVADVIWNIISTADMNLAQSNSNSRGISVGAGVDPLFSVPLFAFSYRF